MRACSKVTTTTHQTTTEWVALAGVLKALNSAAAATFRSQELSLPQCNADSIFCSAAKAISIAIAGAAGIVVVIATAIAIAIIVTPAVEIVAANVTAKKNGERAAAVVGEDERRGRESRRRGFRLSGSSEQDDQQREKSA